MYQPIGIISDEKVPGLASISTYMNKHFSFSKDDPAINEHHYHITKTQYNEETHNIYNTDKKKTCNIKNDRYTYDQYYNKTQHVNNDITNNISNNILHLIVDMY